MQKNWNAKFLAFGGNTPQVFWCRDVIGGLDSFKGKKIRVFNNTMRDFLGGLGATAVSMAFAEVVPALNNGVVDCAVTGSLSGNTAGWPEVAGYLYPLSMGWSINYQSANLEKWQSWSPEVQAFFEQQFAAFQDKMWDTVAAEESAKSPFFKKTLESQRQYASLVVPAKRFMFPPYSFAANYYWPEKAAGAAKAPSKKK